MLRDEPNASTGELIAQIGLYRGELLPGFYEDWVAFERERVQSVFERKMQQLMEQLIAEQQWHSVLEWGERWIALADTPEPAYRALMVAHGAADESAQVALVYEHCVEALRGELGVEPSTETRALYKNWCAVKLTRAPPSRCCHPFLCSPPGQRHFSLELLTNTGILFVLKNGIPWEYLPLELGCGSGMTCWRRLRDWQAAGVWQNIHERLLAALREADQIDWTRTVVDSSTVRALQKEKKQDRIPPTKLKRAASTRSLRMRKAFPWRPF